MHSSTLSLTSALEGVSGQRHVPAVLPPGKTRYPLYRRLGGSKSRSGRIRKISLPNGIRSPDRPARSESLYRLSYCGPWRVLCVFTTDNLNAGDLTKTSPPAACTSVRHVQCRPVRRLSTWTLLRIFSKSLHYFLNPYPANVENMVSS
jgi:hypothetical protein